MSHTQAEKSFIDQYTRKLLVYWAHHQISSPELPELLEPCPAFQCAYGHQVYVDYAVSKGWLSKDGKRVLAKGFSTASSAVKRGL
jgi:hypothetical protein